MNAIQQNSLRCWADGGRGRQAALAEKLGMKPSVVSSWLSGRRPVPVAHAAAIEILTGGAVTRKELFPQDWRRIWPELAESEQNQAAAPANQAQAAINSEAKEGAHA